jgi:hypothetical protein
MRTKISMIAMKITAYLSVRKPARNTPEPIELEFTRDRQNSFPAASSIAAGSATAVLHFACLRRSQFSNGHQIQLQTRGALD